MLSSSNTVAVSYLASLNNKRDSVRTSSSSFSLEESSFVVTFATSAVFLFTSILRRASGDGVVRGTTSLLAPSFLSPGVTGAGACTVLLLERPSLLFVLLLLMLLISLLVLSLLGVVRGDIEEVILLLFILLLRLNTASEEVTKVRERFGGKGGGFSSRVESAPYILLINAETSSFMLDLGEIMGGEVGGVDEVVVEIVCVGERVGITGLVEEAVELRTGDVGVGGGGFLGKVFTNLGIGCGICDILTE